MDGSEIWIRFAHDPRRAENAHLRASDRDRDLVNDAVYLLFNRDDRISAIERNLERRERCAPLPEPGSPDH